MICTTITWKYIYNHRFGISILQNSQAVFFLLETASEYFFIVTSQLQVHTEFFVYILKISFHTLFVTWWFSFVSLFGNSSPLFLFSFISLNFFFLSFSAILQTEFFPNVMTGLETSVKHNLLGYIHNCNLWPGKEPSVPISLQTPVCT